MRIGISHDFFAKGLKDYSNWRAAWVREIAQNSIDAGSKKLAITVMNDDGCTKLVAENDGPPMTEDVLLGKFLCLGGTTKNFENSVGGFGIAKTVLCLAHPRYKIETGSHIITGSGGEFELTEGEFVAGTRTTVWLAEDCGSAIVDQVKKFAMECQWKGRLYLNDTLLETNMKKGARRRDLGWAVVYTNKSLQHRLVVRIDGMPMFDRWISLDRCVLVEVNRSSGEALTSNRDGLTHEYQVKLNSFIDELSVDKSSALRDTPITTYHFFEGSKQASDVSTMAVRDLISAAYATLPQPAGPSAEDTPVLSIDQQTDYNDGPSFVDRATHLRRTAKSQVAHEFVVKNNTGLLVPEHFLPYGFSAYSTRLASIWIKCLLEVHRLVGHKDTFSVGFILDDDREAEYEKTERYGKVYYVNPAVVVMQASSCSRSLKKRWKFNNAGRYMILAAAVHEVVHGLGYDWHDEAFSSKITTLIGLALASKKRFHACFK